MKSWQEWDEAVHGYSRARSRAFVTLRDAKAYWARQRLRERPKQRDQNRGHASDGMMTQPDSALAPEPQFQLPQFQAFALPQFGLTNLQVNVDLAGGAGQGGPLQPFVLAAAAQDVKPVRHATLFVDGASRNNPGQCGAGAVLYDYGSDPNCRPVRNTFKRYLGRATNNEAEYQALIMGLQEALVLGVTHLIAKSDSQLVVRQFYGDDCTDALNLIPLGKQVQQLREQFTSLILVHIGRKANREADALANQAIDEAVGKH